MTRSSRFTIMLRHCGNTIKTLSLGTTFEMTPHSDRITFRFCGNDSHPGVKLDFRSPLAAHRAAEAINDALINDSTSVVVDDE